MNAPFNPDTFIRDFLANVGTSLDHVSDPYDATLGTNKTRTTLPVSVRGKLGRLRVAVQKIIEKFVRARGELENTAISRGQYKSTVLNGDRRKLNLDQFEQLCAAREDWYCHLPANEKAAFDSFCLASAGSAFSGIIPKHLPVCLHGPLARLALEAADLARRFNAISIETEKSLRERELSNQTVMSGILKGVDEDKSEAISRLVERWFRELTPQQAAAFDNDAFDYDCKNNEDIGAIQEKPAQPKNLGTATSLRLHCEDATYTLTIDGHAYHIENPTAYMIYKLLAAETPQPLTRADLQARIRGCKGRKAIRQLLDTLPEPVRRTARSGSRGYWIDLSPRHPGKRRTRKKGRG